MCELHKQAPFDLLVTAGDNIYETGAAADFKAKFFEPMACLLRKNVQFRSALGNHDIVSDNGRPELHEPRFGMNGRNYVIREGGVRFVIADSNDLRKRWMNTALKTQEGDRWTVVVFHHPVYSSSSHHESTDDFRFTLPPMFEKRGVDLVVTGHTHIYAVTKPLHKIRYVTTGGGSASPHDCDPKWYTERCIVEYHFLSIAAGDDKMTVAAIGPSGKTIDRFSTTGRN
jgi:predicted phosphodiesterase